MNKKYLIGLVVVVLISFLVVGAYFLLDKEGAESKEDVQEHQSSISIEKDENFSDVPEIRRAIRDNPRFNKVI